MSSAFDVAPSALADTAAEVDRVHGALAAALGEVRADVTSLVGGSWRGGAAQAFLAGFEEWQHGAEVVLAALDDVGAALGATRTAYVGSDVTASDGFARLAARLGGDV